MVLYDNIRKYRLQRKMTQQQLADLTGYGDRSSIAKIEKGLVDIPQSKVELFAKVLHVPAGELMGTTDADTATLSPATVKNSMGLSESEEHLLSNYRQLNEEGQEIVQNTAEGLVASGRYIKIDETRLVEEKA